MSVAKDISKRIKHMQKGKPFTNAVFAEVGSRPQLIKRCHGWCRAAF